VSKKRLKMNARFVEKNLNKYSINENEIIIITKKVNINLIPIWYKILNQFNPCILLHF